MKKTCQYKGGGLTILVLAWICFPSSSFPDQLAFLNEGYARHGNYCNAVAISSGYAYTCYDNGLNVYDISNPSSPVRVGYASGAGYSLGIDLSGNYAYVANGGLAIFSISNPTNPVSIGSVPASGTVTDVTISGSLAFLVTGRDGFRIVDVSNPTNPVPVGHFDNHSITLSFTPYSGGIAVADNHAYVANGNDGLRVFNVSDPTNPISVAHTNNGGNALSIALSNNYAFLANNNDGIRVYEISNPSNVINVAHAPGEYATRLCISAGYLYAANDGGGLHVYDISDPTNIVDVGNARTQDFPGGITKDVVVTGNNAYVANWNDGFRRFQIDSLLNIRLEGLHQVTVWWAWFPGIPADLSLQHRNDLVADNWVSLTNTAVLVGNKRQVVLPWSPGSHYFRHILN